MVVVVVPGSSDPECIIALAGGPLEARTAHVAQIVPLAGGDICENIPDWENISHRKNILPSPEPKLQFAAVLRASESCRLCLLSRDS